MIGMNHWSGCGNLTKDPVLRYMPDSGDAVCTIRLGITRPYKNKKTGKYDADFIDVILWRKTAEYVAKTFVKGDPVGVEGRIQTYTYEDKEGNRRSGFRIVADLIVDLRNNRRIANNSTQPQQTNQQTNQTQNADSQSFEDEFFAPVDDDEIPF